MTRINKLYHEFYLVDLVKGKGNEKKKKDNCKNETFCPVTESVGNPEEILSQMFPT